MLLVSHLGLAVIDDYWDNVEVCRYDRVCVLLDNVMISFSSLMSSSCGLRMVCEWPAKYRYGACYIRAMTILPLSPEMCSH